MVVLAVAHVALCTACAEEGDEMLWLVAGEGTTWTDPASGLTWQVLPPEGWMKKSAAADYCSSLTLGGQSDWRLPTIGELRSLIRGCPATESGGSCNVEAGDCLAISCRADSCTGCSGGSGPADGCYWPDNIQGECTWYWSSSPVGDDDDRAWGVHFYGGDVGHGDVVYDDGSVVRCVR